VSPSHAATVANSPSGLLVFAAVVYVASWMTSALSEAGVDVSALCVGLPGGGLELAARVVEVHQEWVAGLVVDLDQACRCGGLVRRRCDDDGDVLSVVVDAVVLQRRRRREA
jgi:hypothetical protein